MLVFVDLEHEGSRGEAHAQQLLAARTTLTYRLEDLSGLHCHLVRYNKLDQALLDAIGARAIFISGNSSPPEMYHEDEVAAIHHLIATTALPIFGFCGGFQLIGQALGAPLTTLEPLPDAPEGDSIISTPEGLPYEFGYHPVDLAAGAAEHPLLENLGASPVFRHAHGLHLPSPPPGFRVLASTAITPVQMATDDKRSICGTQLHPEYWTDEHPDGRTMIANFLRWAEITDGSVS